MIQRARDLKELRYKGSAFSLFPYFTQQAQDICKLFGPAKRRPKSRLQELQLDYAMICPAHMRVMIEGKATICSDPNQLQKFLKSYPKAGTWGVSGEAGSGGAQDTQELDNAE